MTRSPFSRLAALRRWLAASRGRKLGVAMAALAIAVLAGSWGGHSYAEASPGFCLSCHADQEPEVQACVHRDAPCQACHEPSLWGAVRQLAWGDDSSSPHGAATPDKCRHCHVDGSAEVPQIGDSLGHQLHSSGTTQVPCATCHNAAPHDLRPQHTGRP
ncbi:MAG: hypothetical protein JRI68_36105 [Deltaproteobacteria bacterium]|nr:hypothetical protein [Deltaproteobacteria bacterium]